MRKLATERAIDLIAEAVSHYGILASPIVQDNYARVWSRDSMIAGLAGLLLDNAKIIEGLRRSLYTLGRYQHEVGMIPSNVYIGKDGSTDISYGSVVGRIDASTWYLAISCLYLEKTRDTDFISFVRPVLNKIRNLLRAWEYNGKGLLYTPLSGNWADEYPITGYTLYDNVLRVWGEINYHRLFLKHEAPSHLLETIIRNFWPLHHNEGGSDIYSPSLLALAIEQDKSHFATSFGPDGYDQTFDCAGHAICLFLNKLDSERKDKLEIFLNDLFDTLTKPVVPAFWPCITPGSNKWERLQSNYAFAFKNYPHKFHNGGIWPVWMGLLCMGLSRNDMQEHANKVANHFFKALHKSDYRFFEFMSSDTFEFGGKERLCFSAAGTIFMSHSLESSNKEFVL